jgi:hypothetical protein
MAKHMRKHMAKTEKHILSAKYLREENERLRSRLAEAGKEIVTLKMQINEAALAEWNERHYECEVEVE